MRMGQYHGREFWSSVPMCFLWLGLQQTSRISGEICARVARDANDMMSLPCDFAYKIM